MAVLETSLMVSQSINIINILTYKNKTFFTHPSLTLIFEYFTESFSKKKNVCIFFSKIIMEQLCKIVLILIRHPVLPNYMLLLTTTSIQNLWLFSNFTFHTDLVTLSIVVYNEKSCYIWHQSVKNSFWHFWEHFGKNIINW